MSALLLGLLALAVAFASLRRALLPAIIVAVLGLEYFSPGDPASLLTVPKVGLGAVVAAQLLLRQTPVTLLSRRVLVPLALLSAYLCASVLWSIDPDRSMIRVSTIVLLLIAYTIVVSFVKSPADLQRFWTAFVLYGVASAITALAQLFFGFNLYSDNVTTRAGGLGVNPSEGAFYMGLAWLIVFVYHLKPRLAPPKMQLLPVRVGLLVVLAVGILVTASRGGALSIIAGSFAVGVDWRRERHRVARLLKVAVTFAAVAIVALYLAPWLLEPYSLRFASSLQDSFGNRQGIFSILWTSFLEHPLLGTGLNTTAAVTRGVDEFATVSSHNVVLGVLADGGVIGGTLLCVLVAVVYRALRQVRRDPPPALEASGRILLGLFVCAGVFMLTHDVLLNKLLWVCLALLEADVGLMRRVPAQAARRYRPAVLQPPAPATRGAG